MISYNVVQQICGCPRDSDTDHWNCKNDVVGNEDNDDVCQPHSTAVEIVVVRIWVAAGNAHIHFESCWRVPKKYINIFSLSRKINNYLKT